MQMGMREGEEKAGRQGGMRDESCNDGFSY